MGVANHLACLCPRYRETHAVHDVVETKLQLAEEVLAGDARTGICLLEVALELALENAVYATDLLLLAQLHAVVADFAATTACSCARSRRSVAYTAFSSASSRATSRRQIPVRASPARTSSASWSFVSTTSCTAWVSRYLGQRHARWLATPISP